MSAPDQHRLSAEKVAPGNYAVTVGDKRAFDTFHFRTKRDAQRFVMAGNRAVSRTRAR